MTPVRAGRQSARSHSVVGSAGLLGTLVFGVGCAASRPAPLCVTDVMGCPRDVDHQQPTGAPEAEQSHNTPRDRKHARERSNHLGHEGRTPRK